MMPRLIAALLVALMLPVGAFASGQFGMMVKEVDNSPSGFVYREIFPNTTLSITAGEATIDFSTLNDATYLRLDASNDPLTGELSTSADIRSNTTASCSAITTASINGTPIDDGTTIYNAQPLGAFGFCGGPGGCDRALWVFDTGLTTPTAVCCNAGAATSLSSFWTTDTFADGVALDMCLFTATGWGNAKLSMLTTTGDCTALANALSTSFAAAITVPIDDSQTAFFEWNSSTCEYDTNMKAGWSYWSGESCGANCSAATYPASPVLATDSVPVYNFTIDESTGDIQTVGGLEVSGTAIIGSGDGNASGIPDGVGLKVSHNLATDLTDQLIVGLDFSAYNTTTTNNSSAITVGMYGGPYIKSGATGDTGNLIGALFSGGNDGAGDIAETSLAHGIMYHNGAGTIADAYYFRGDWSVLSTGNVTSLEGLSTDSYYDLFNAEGGGVVADFTVVPIQDITGFDICVGGGNPGVPCPLGTECSLGTCTGTHSAYMTAANGVKIATQSNPSAGFGLDIGWRSRFLDDIPLYFGTTLDIGIDWDSGNSRLNITPLTDTDVVLYFDATTSDGTLSWMEDEKEFKTLNPVEIETVSDAGVASLLLDQDDVDEPFLHYQGTSAASVANNVSTWKGGGTIEGYVKVEVAGDGDYWMPYTSAPSQTMPYREITATTNTTANDYIILCTAASADYDVELINVASVNGQVLVIKNKAASTYDVGVDPNGSQNIDNNSTSATLNPGDSITIMSNGTEWSIH